MNLELGGEINTTFKCGIQQHKNVVYIHGDGWNNSGKYIDRKEKRDQGKKILLLDLATWRLLVTLVHFSRIVKADTQLFFHCTLNLNLKFGF